MTEQQFDPSTHTVTETVAYLEGADSAERQRVQDAEAAGSNRVGIVGWTPSVDDLQPDDDGYTRVPVPEDQAYVPGEPVKDTADTEG